MQDWQQAWPVVARQDQQGYARRRAGRAPRHFAAIAEKIDPSVERAKAAAKASDTIEPLLDDFIAYLRRDGRAESYLREVERSLRRYFRPLHRLNAADINRAMVAKPLATIRTERGPIAADRSRAHLSKFFSWAIAEGHAEHNPVSGTNKTGSKARDRVLKDSELAAIWNALGRRRLRRDLPVIDPVRRKARRGRLVASQRNQFRAKADRASRQPGPKTASITSSRCRHSRCRSCRRANRARAAILFSGAGKAASAAGASARRGSTRGSILNLGRCTISAARCER